MTAWETLVTIYHIAFYAIARLTAICHLPCSLSQVTTSRVRDLHPGFVVVKFEGESFDSFDAASVELFVVVQANPTILKDLKTDAPVSIR